MSEYSDEQMRIWAEGDELPERNPLAKFRDMLGEYWLPNVLVRYSNPESDKYDAEEKRLDGKD